MSDDEVEAVVRLCSCHGVVLSDCVNNKIMKLRNEQLDIGATWARRLIGSRVQGLSARGQSARQLANEDVNMELTIDTSFGRLRLCPQRKPLEVKATNEGGVVVATSIESLSELLSLPERTGLEHWYNHENGGPTPEVTISHFSFTAEAVSGRLGGSPTEKWEPHLSGKAEVKLHWKSQETLRRGLKLPPFLYIEVKSDYTKMMWDVTSGG